MYIYTYTLYIYIYGCIHVHTHVFAYLFTFIYEYMYICMYSVIFVVWVAFGSLLLCSSFSYLRAYHLPVSIENSLDFAGNRCIEFLQSRV